MGERSMRGDDGVVPMYTCALRQLTPVVLLPIA